jgi:predicted DNA-binding transcriptional regulator AlpA
MSKTERNEMLRREYASSVPVPDLMEIYGLSRSRLYQIVNPSAYEGQQARAKEKSNG